MCWISYYSRFWSQLGRCFFLILPYTLQKVKKYIRDEHYFAILKQILKEVAAIFCKENFSNIT